MRYKVERILLTGLAFVLLGLLGLALPALDVAAATSAPALTITQINDQTLRLTLTLGDWQLGETTVDGRRYAQLSIAGTTLSEQAGRPQLPVTGTLLGVPTGENLSVTVVESKATRIALPQPLLPAAGVQLDAAANDQNGFNLPATRLVTTPDAAVYRQTTAYPGTLAAVGFSGVLRGQPVAQIVLNPVQYTPGAAVADIYTRLVVDVSWPTGARAALDGRTVTPVYEQLLARTLGNYAALERPRPVAAPQPRELLQAPQSDSAPLKLYVDKTGIVEVRYADLVAAGWNVTAIDPRNLQLTQRGAPVSMWVTGESDGTLNPADTLRFYGEAYEDLYVDQNIYWLTVGTAPGARMAERAVATDGAPPLADFPVKLHLERDSYYWNTLTYAAADEDFWFWGNQLAPNAIGLDNTRTLSFTLTHLPTQPYTATLSVYLKGRTSGNHASRLILNGNDLGQKSFAGTSRSLHSVAFPAALLVEGVNTLAVQAINTGNFISQWHLNWVEVDYRALPIADNSQLALTQPLTSEARLTLTGFISTPRLFDVTQPAAPVRVLPAAPALSITAVLTPGNYYAATRARFSAPAAIVPAQPAVWSDPPAGADYIVISHANFLPAAQRLADHRAAQGLRMAVVDVQALYDHFDHGFATPGAIRNFLLHAYANWAAPAPTYVVLVGDGNQDYKRLLGGEDTGFIPPRMINTNDYGQVPSDNWYVAIEGNDVLPELLIGRISVASMAQADRVVDTIIAHDSQPLAPGSALFVADDLESAFENISAALVTKLPYHWLGQRLDVADYTTPTVARDITTTVAGNMTMVNYAGHGNHYRWGSYRLNRINYRILTGADLPSIADAQVKTFWTALNCLNGFFSIPPAVAGEGTQLSFAEAVQHNAGVAIWADSALGYSSGQLLIMGHLYDAMFRDGMVGLGAVTTEAKLRTVASAPFWTRMVETFVLFGDPVTALNAPNYPYVVQTTPQPAAAGVAVNTPIVVRFNKRMDPASVTLTDTLGSVYTAHWNTTRTEATFSHPPYPTSTQINLTISGYDITGQALQDGPASMSWSFSTFVPTATTLSGNAVRTAGPAFWLSALLLAATLALFWRRRRIMNVR